VSRVRAGTPLSSRSVVTLIAEVHKAQFEYVRGRMNAMREVRADPGAALFFEAEHLRVCIAPGVPNPAFNQLFLSGPAALEDLERALALFAQHGMQPQLDIGPDVLSPELTRCLGRHGFVSTHSYPVLVWPGGAEPRFESNIQVARVDSATTLDAFKGVYVRGWQAEAWLAPILQSYIARWLDTPGWTLYLASDQDLPIAVGILFEHRHVAYLADAATIPERRSHGAQRALIARRIADGRQNGAGLIFSRADLGSGSQRNLERAGLAARCSAELWTKAPGARA
jgi:hypothetical protein